jgi:hypothetical protein
MKKVIFFYKSKMAKNKAEEVRQLPTDDTTLEKHVQYDHHHEHLHHHEHHDHHLVWCPRHNHYYEDKAVIQVPCLETDANELTGMRDFIAGSCAGISSTGKLPTML